MRKIKTLQLLNVIKMAEDLFSLTLQINSQTRTFQVSFDRDFVPRMFNVKDDLRQILVTNPQATQEIIQTLTKIDKDRILIFPITLSVWQDVLKPQVV